MERTVPNDATVRDLVEMHKVMEKFFAILVKESEGYVAISCDGVDLIRECNKSDTLAWAYMSMGGARCNFEIEDYADGTTKTGSLEWVNIGEHDGEAVLFADCRGSDLSIVMALAAALS